MQVDSGSGSVSEEDNNLVLSSSTPDECELGLGLSLGGFGGNGGHLKMNLKTPRIGPKILTSEDFDLVVSASSSSPSSCSSSSSTSGRANGGGGTKRAADSISASNAASQVVGWPPIRAYRMNNLATNNGKSKEFDSESEKRNCIGKINHQDSSNLCLKPFLVKVNLDGVPIGRKVDLNAHNCYKTLSQTLENMFFSTNSKNVNAGRELNLLDGSSGFALTYEDKEGDMMLVGDVPWRMFVNSVKRLRIMRSTKANGIICM